MSDKEITSQVKEQKKHLRKVFLRKRRSLSHEKKLTRESLITEAFRKKLPSNTKSIVHCFLPIEKQNEINTYPIIEYLDQSDGKVVVSRSDTEDNTMTHFLYEGKNRLETNKWGIPEPVSGKRISANEIDIVLVPLVIFDKLGNRIGYGKGYYDRFLTNCRADCTFIGLSLAPPVDVLPCIEEMDVKLDYCISPMGLHTFNTYKKLK
ncbi:MAG: 5-formyltetrahydrofolate cyclo-ligase [Cyclobacteriaceae bacterium]